MQARYWAVIPAAGVGRRMGATRPKQYLELAGCTILEHTLARFCNHPKITGVIVALARNDRFWGACRYAGHAKVETTLGGAERYQTTAKALEQLATMAMGEDWVLVHDAVRPCVRSSDIDRLMAEGSRHAGGAILAVPVSDTLKRVDGQGIIRETVSRERLWRAFTPQMFRLQDLRQAMQQVLDQGLEVTDEAEAMALSGNPPGVVRGRADNIKITHPDDLVQAAIYLEAE